MKPFDAQTAFFVAGLLYIAMPLTVWSILRGRHDPASVRRWTAGGLAFGTGLVLIGLRDAVPAWLSIVVANLLAFGSYPLRWHVLRREAGRPGLPLASTALWGVFSIAFVLAYARSAGDGPRVAVATMAHLVGGLALVAAAWQVWRQRGFGSAALLAAAYAFFCGAACIRFVLVLAHDGDVRAFGGDLGFGLLYLAAIVSALYGNLGYLGIALETARRDELARTAQLASEQSERREAQRHAVEQALLVRERTELLAQREQMLASLARRIQQPLNNASAALQSAMSELGRFDAKNGAAQRLERAHAVMARVQCSVDNILADATLPSDEGPTARHDADVDALIELAIADMDPAQRPRIRIERLTGTRTASMNENLMRLALRNLLANALQHARPASAVTVRIADSDLPLGLLIDVSDEGPGLPDGLTQRLFGRGERGRGSGTDGDGLGLHVARRVMRLHGGDVGLLRNGPDGACFRLTLPAIPQPAAQIASSLALKT